MSLEEQDLAVTQGMPMRPGAHGRFFPGSVIEKRYRIVALAGRGGMGEVYRADDLKLGQPVALKFLPADLERDPERLKRLIDEVRVARQVSHPNACRVHDLGEFEGHHFITMEYVDGEDLAALLLRIGRLPQEKALDLARQMAGGLAAAHAEGIVHRDLKPANVMLDGRGRARITDFGLAAAVAGIHGAEAQWGTPAYMAPEQLRGEEVTARTDVYALGLVLYEMFTGRRAFNAPSTGALVTAQQAPPAPPSSFVSGLPSAIDGAILRCLEHDAALRPSSAAGVLALLPGTDPLAAALRAGETPSPQMVAGAGRTEALPAAQAFGLLGFALITTALALVLVARSSELNQLPMPRSPDALREQAREIVRQLGGETTPRSSEWWFDVDPAFADWSARHPSPSSVDAAGSAAFRFHYRQSPRSLIPDGYPARSKKNPAPEWGGEAYVALDPAGRLLEYSRIPRQLAPVDSAGAAAIDWSGLLALTGRDARSLVSTSPSWTPDVASDARAAWLVPAAPTLRLEAAAWRGRPVWLRTVTPWSRAERDAPLPGSPSVAVFVFIVLGVVAALGALARHNLRLGRGDPRGAMRLAVAVFLGFSLHGVLAGYWGLDPVHLWRAIQDQPYFPALAAWLIYMGMEPFLRRHWPHRLIAWTRLLEGKFTDPLVGREVLLGIGAASVSKIAGAGSHLMAHRQSLGQILSEPLAGAPDFWGAIAGSVSDGILKGLGSIALMLVFWMIFRRDWIAWLAPGILVLLTSLPQGNTPAVQWIGLVIAIVVITLATRIGLLAAVVSWAALNLIGRPTPLTLDPSRWYAWRTAVIALLLLAWIGWGFRAAFGRRPLLSSAWLER